MADPGPKARYVLSQRLRLHCLDWGHEEAPALLLLHGARDHCRSWDFAARELSGKWRVIAPDLRGHGDSDWSSDGNYTLMAYLCDLAELVEALGLGPVAIVGHSMSAQIALRYAALYPGAVRQLIAIEPFNLIEEGRTGAPELHIAARMEEWIRQKRLIADREPRSYATAQEARQRMLEENPSLTPVQAGHLTHHGIRLGSDGRYRWKFDPCVNVWDWVDMAPAERDRLLERVACPTLLLYGGASTMTPPERRVGVLHATTTLFERAGHWLHYDHRAEFLAAMHAFLERPSRVCARER